MCCSHLRLCVRVCAHAHACVCMCVCVFVCMLCVSVYLQLYVLMLASCMCVYVCVCVCARGACACTCVQVCPISRRAVQNLLNLTYALYALVFFTNELCQKLLMPFFGNGGGNTA